MTTDVENIGEPKAQCRSCGSAMPKGYPLCKTCNSYQDLRRYLSFSTPVLSLLVALVTVVGFNVKEIATMIHPPRAALSAGANLLENHLVEVTASNLGGVTGIVDPVLLCASGDEYLQFAADAGILIPPNGVATARLRPISTFFLRYLEEVQKPSKPDGSDSELGFASSWSCRISGRDKEGALGNIELFNSELELYQERSGPRLRVNGYFSAPE